MKVFISVLGLLFLGHFGAATADEPTGTWEAAAAEITRLNAEGNCAEAWDLAWSWAKAGNAQARVDLAVAIALLGYSPPGDPADLFSMIRHAFTLMVHTDAEAEELMVDEYTTVMRVLMDLADDDKLRLVRRYGQCLNGELGELNCRDFAVQIGLVPSFDDYARQVDAVAASGGGHGATCEGRKVD